MNHYADSKRASDNCEHEKGNIVSDQKYRVVILVFDQYYLWYHNSPLSWRQEFWLSEMRSRTPPPILMISWLCMRPKLCPLILCQPFVPALGHGSLTDDRKWTWTFPMPIALNVKINIILLMSLLPSANVPLNAQNKVYKDYSKQNFQVVNFPMTITLVTRTKIL